MRGIVAWMTATSGAVRDDITTKAILLNAAMAKKTRIPRAYFTSLMLRLSKDDFPDDNNAVYECIDPSIAEVLVVALQYSNNTTSTGNANVQI